MSADVERLSVSELGAAYRTRELSPVEATRALLERIERLDGRVGAFITVTADLALTQARRAERALAQGRGDGRPLLGVPLALKDLVETRGIRTTAASPVLANHVPERDATVWRRLRRAGAVLIGKANTHEFAYGGTTEPTRNPWDLDRMVGGSSGGSAAAVAAAMCPAAIGSDSAGSVRIPAGFCGLFGLKPSRGLVSRTGVIPLSPTLDTTGPLARTPVDAGLLMDAMAGLDREDEASVRGPRAATFVPAAGRDSAGPLRVGVVAGTDPMTDGVREAVRRACGAFLDMGARVDEVSVGSLDAATETCFTIMAVEAADFHEAWLRERGDVYTPYVRERIEAGFEISGVRYRRALAEATRVAARWDAELVAHDVLLLPGMPCPAPVAYVETIEIAGESHPRDYLICRNTAFANVSGHPALAVPVGLEDGVPVGVQLVGARMADARVLQAGQMLFERLGGGEAAPDPPAA